jgi:large subunit ribosomal protein L15e
MGIYKYMREYWKNPDKERVRELRLKFRREKVFTRVDKPTKIARARSLGYKDKPGLIVVRVRIGKGGRNRPKPSGGRKPSKSGLRKFSPKKSLQWIAEERVQRKYPNLRVMSSYLVIEDGKHKWFETMMLDPEHPEIKSDKELSRIASQPRRAQRGLTPAGKTSRGLRNKGRGAEKIRPSIRAKGGKGK